MNRSKLNMSFAREAAPALRALLLITVIFGVATLSSRAQDTGNGIEFHGGPVMVNPHPVHIIWYGNWNGNSALTLLPNFISGLNGSPYFAINTTYENSGHTNISGAVTLGAQTFDSYSQGTTLSDTGLRNVISSAMSRGAVPVDPNGVYFVLSSGDVNQQGSHGTFCVQFCGFHGNTSLFGSDIKFAFVGNASPRCINNPNSSVTCAPLNSVVSPNGNPGADAMANTIAHELSEAVTDPDLNAWFHGDGSHENGDLCNFNFGSTFTTPNGAQANVFLGGLNFLVQQNWLNDGGGGCTMASSGNPFTYRSARDQFLACYGIAGRISSNCTDISDVNDKQTCFAVSDSTQTPCTTSMTDRNMQLACYGIAFAPNFPSNCRDISNPQMQAFCYGASSGNTNPPPNCNNLANADTRALCLGMSLHDPTQCSSIANHNDRQFCLGVSSHDNSNCASISSCPNPDAQASCINSGGSWNWTSCSCSFSSSCDPTQEQSCIDSGGSWDPNTCTCSGGCGTQIICAQKPLAGQTQAAAPLPPTQLKLRNPLPIARPLPRAAEQK